MRPSAVCVCVCMDKKPDRHSTRSWAAHSFWFGFMMSRTNQGTSRTPFYDHLMCIDGRRYSDMCLCEFKTRKDNAIYSAKTHDGDT